MRDDFAGECARLADDLAGLTWGDPEDARKAALTLRALRCCARMTREGIAGALFRGECSDGYATLADAVLAYLRGEEPSDE